VVEAQPGRRPPLEQHVELGKHHATHHHLQDESSYPLDGIVLIAGEAGEGLRDRRAKRHRGRHHLRAGRPHGGRPEARREAPGNGADAGCGEHTAKTAATPASI